MTFFYVQDQLIPHSAWKDYSAANTNYAFDAFETEEKHPTNGGAHPRTPTKVYNTNLPPSKQAAAAILSSTQTLPYYEHSRSLQRSNGKSNHNYSHGGYQQGHSPPVSYQMQPDRSTYSLPRTNHGHALGNSGMHNGYYTQDRRAHRNQGHQQQHVGDMPADFYFMPSQRKYSGEVVRVYVDYNKDPK